MMMTLAMPAWVSWGAVGCLLGILVLMWLFITAVMFGITENRRKRRAAASKRRADADDRPKAHVS